MSAIKGFSSDQKIGLQEYMTLQKISGGKAAADMLPKAVYSIQVPNFIPEGGTLSSIRLTAHQAQVGDMIRFDAGPHKGIELTVSKIEANEIFFNYKLSAAVTAADEFKILKYLTLTISEDGSLQTSQGPIQIVKDAAVVQVNKDTVDPNNTVTMPVEIVGADGAVINITAGDINVQNSHTGANPDSIQVGNGFNIMDVNASKEALTHDADVLAELLLQKALLTSIDGKDFSTATKQDAALVELQAILAKIIAAPSTEAKQDTVITALGSLLTELQAKADLTETQPVSAASLPLPLGAATEAKQDSAITELQSILAKIIAAPATEAKQDTAITALGSLLTELQLKADLTETQPVSLASIPLATGAATEAKQDSAITELQSILAKIIAAPATEAKQDTIITSLSNLEDTTKVLDTFLARSPIDFSSSNLPAVGDTTGLELVASTTTRLRKIQSIDDAGVFIGLYSGAPSSLVLEAILPIAGGVVEVDIPSGTRLSIKHLEASVVSVGKFAANLIG